MGDSTEMAPRTLSAPVERARLEALIDRGRRSPKSYLLVGRVMPSRRQEKIATFGERKDGRIVVDWEGLRRAHPGEALRFQLRERGQVLGTAQWHVPESMLDQAPPSQPVISRHPVLPSALPHSDGGGAAWLSEVQRLREDLAASRAESALLAEEARRARTELERERTARLRAEAERDLARKAEESRRVEVVGLQERLLAAALDRKESEIAFRLLADRVPVELQEVHRLVTGRG